LHYKVFITANAQSNLEEIIDYIKLDSKSRAQAWLKSVKDKIISLRTYPRRGRLVPEYEGEKEIREIIWGSYRIIYEIDADRIYVLYIYHGARLLIL